MIVQLRNFKNIFLVPELRRKVFFTFAVLAVYRFGVHIPIPGINTHVLSQFTANFASSGFMAYMNLFSGGALKQFSIFSLGMMPYINASIMMQILSVTIPSLEQLSKEGAYGRQKINQYTRYLALAVSVMQGFGGAMLVENQVNLALVPGWWFRISTTFILCVGALFIMWLSEQINSHGIGNGSSMVIFAGIIAGLPSAVFKLVNGVQLGTDDPLKAVFVVALTVAVIACIVFLEKGERRVPVHYARKVVGNRVYGGQSSYIPFKLNSASIIPVIFSGSIMSMIMMVTNFTLKGFWVADVIAQALDHYSPMNWALTSVLIIIFAYFYTALIFDPSQLADNIRKSGGFIPGVRPGRKTAEFFEYLLDRVCLPGSIYLATMAVAPRAVASSNVLPVMFDGMSLLIVVGVALDVSAQIESYLIERKYEGFLSSGRLKGRLGR
ncbi:MAG: preprotein translocase subunit SecY [Candidatus Dependentiae bacterium]